MGRGKGCRNPTVENCLNCKKKECDVISCCPLHVSEIMAEINVGMLPMAALAQHRKRLRQMQGKPRGERSRTD